MLREHILGKIPLKYLNFARQKLNALYLQAKGSGITSLVKYFYLGDGTRIKVSVTADDGWIRITGGECPTMYSGLIEAVDDDGYVVVNTENLFSRFYPRSGTEWTNTRELLNLSDVDQPGARTYRPGLYSGEMRKVVQDLMGRNAVIPYGFGWSTTHGVYTSADGGKWVIEVSADGVLAWRMGICAKGGTLSGSLDYIPVATPKPADAENIITLANAAAVATPYGKSPLFSACGWAFSASGAKICNVTLETSGSYYYTRLYEITITETNNAPSSASLQELEGDYLWGPRSGGSRCWIKLPGYGAEDPVVDSWDISLGQNTAPAASFISPVHAWYEGETMKVVRMNYEDTGVTNVSDTDPWPLPHNAGYSPWTSIIGTWGTYTSQNITSCFTSPLLDAVVNRNIVGDYYTRYVEDQIDLGQATIGGIGAHVAVYEDLKDGAEILDDNVDVLVLPLNDREAVYHVRQVINYEEATSLSRTVFACYNGNTYTSIPSGFCFEGSGTAPPPLHIGGYVSGSSMEVHGAGVFGYAWLALTPVASLPGWLPGLGCPAFDWFTYTNDYAFEMVDISASPYSSETRTNSGKAYIEATQKDVLLTDDDMTAWVRDTTSALDDTPQIIMAVVDMTGNVDAIYSNTPYPDTTPLADTLTGGGTYPVDELTLVHVAFIGNP